MTQLQQKTLKGSIPKGMLFLGIDPGLSNSGLAIIEVQERQVYKLIDYALVVTQPMAQKSKTYMRVSADDKRRYTELCKEFIRLVNKYPNLKGVGVENYRPMVKREKDPITKAMVSKGQMGGNAWKTGVVFGGFMFASICFDLFLVSFQPNDLKTRFCGVKSASKRAIQNAIMREVEGTPNVFSQIAKGKVEHLADAIGHSVLVAEEYIKNLHFLGVTDAS